MAKWKRAKIRRGYTVQLIAGIDDSLIRYMDGMEKGQRAKFMRDALYKGAKVKPPPMPEVVNYRTLQQEVDALRMAITQSQSTAPAAGIDPDTVQRIDYLHRWLEDITKQLPAFIDDRIAQLVPGGFVAGSQPGNEYLEQATMPTEAQVDPAELEKRARRMKAATW